MFVELNRNRTLVVEWPDLIGGHEFEMTDRNVGRTTKDCG